MNYNKNTTNIYVFLYNSKNKQKYLYGAAAGEEGGAGLYIVITKLRFQKVSFIFPVLEVLVPLRKVPPDLFLKWRS